MEKRSTPKIDRDDFALVIIYPFLLNTLLFSSLFVEVNRPFSFIPLPIRGGPPSLMGQGMST